MNIILLILMLWFTACADSGGKLKDAKPAEKMDTIYMAPYLNKAFIMSSTSAVSYIRHFAETHIPAEQIMGLYHFANSPADSGFAHFQLEAWPLDSVQYQNEDSLLCVHLSSLPTPATLADGQSFVHESYEKAFMNSFLGTLYSFPSIAKARVYMDGKDLTEICFVNLMHAKHKRNHLYNPGLFHVHETGYYNALSIVPCWYNQKEMGFVPVHHDKCRMQELIIAQLSLCLNWELEIGAGLAVDSVQQIGKQLTIYLPKEPKEKYKMKHAITALAYSIMSNYGLKINQIELLFPDYYYKYIIIHP